MKKNIIILVLGLALLPFISNAQGKLNKHSQEMFDQIESAKIAFFTSEIGLTTEEAAPFWALYNKYSDEIRNAHKDKDDEMKKLDKMAKAKASDVELKMQIQKLVNAEKREPLIQEAYIPEFYKILPTEKVAKIFTTESRFRMKMIEMWRHQNHKGRTKND